MNQDLPILLPIPMPTSPFEEWIKKQPYPLQDPVEAYIEDRCATLIARQNELLMQVGPLKIALNDANRANTILRSRNGVLGDELARLKGLLHTNAEVTRDAIATAIKLRKELAELKAWPKEVS